MSHCKHDWGVPEMYVLISKCSPLIICKKCGKHSYPNKIVGVGGKARDSYGRCVNKKAMNGFGRKKCG